MHTDCMITIPLPSSMLQEGAHTSGKMLQYDHPQAREGARATVADSAD